MFSSSSSSSKPSVNNPRQRPISARRPGARYLCWKTSAEPEEEEEDRTPAQCEQTRCSPNEKIVDEQEHTLSAYGEISLSNPYLICSTETDVSPSEPFEPGKPAFPKRISRLVFGKSQKTPSAIRVQAHVATPTPSPSPSKFGIKSLLNNLKRFNLPHKPELPTPPITDPSIPGSGSGPNEEEENWEDRLSGPTFTSNAWEADPFETNGAIAQYLSPSYRPLSKVHRRLPIPQWPSEEMFVPFEGWI